MARTLVLTLMLVVSATIKAIAFAQEVCSLLPPTQEDPRYRAKLMAETKSRLLDLSHQSLSHLLDLRQCFLGDSRRCHAFDTPENLRALMRRQLTVYKLLQPITKARPWQLARISRPALTKNLRDRPEVLRAQARFEHFHFEYSEQERRRVIELWKNTLLMAMGEEIESGRFGDIEAVECDQFTFDNSVAVFRAVQNGFEGLEKNLLESNPVLEYLKEGDFEDLQAGAFAFDQVLSDKSGFLQRTFQLRTNHRTEWWSYPWLLLPDHEMGLVNFSALFETIIEELPQEEQAKACASWAFLQRQQQNRVQASIGTGFATAIGCGLGVWSGIGVGFAAKSCLPNFADALIGGSRGLIDAQYADQSRLIGRSIATEDRPSALQPLRTHEKADQLLTQGRIVAFANFIGIVPVLQSVRTATQGARGSLSSLAKMPATDASVTTVEVNSGLITLAFMLGARSLELARLPQASSFETVFRATTQCLGEG